MIKLYTIPGGIAVIFESHLFDTDRVSYDMNGNIIIDGDDSIVYDVTRVEDTSSDADCCNIIESTKVHIPKLKLAVKKIYQASDGSQIQYPTDRMFVSWQSNDMNFMLHSPEIWLFRYKKGTAKSDLDGMKLLETKKMVHPPHLNGIKYPGSNFYTGTAVNYFKKPYETEFSFNATADKFFEVPIKVAPSL